MFKLSHLFSWVLMCTFMSLLATSNVALALNLAGVVEQAKGHAYIANSSGKKEMRIGTEVKEGDEIYTENESEALVRMTDGTVFAVRPNTQIVVANYQFKVEDKKGHDDNLLVKLVKGGLRTLSGKIGKRNPSQFKVSTPTATIGIRGTDFEVAVVDKDKAEAQAGTYNKVFDGRTFMENAQGKSVEVGANQAAFSPSDAMKIAQQFGILKNVPNVFFNGTFDGLLSGLQEEAFKRLESKIGIPIPDEVKKLVPNLGDFFN